LIRFAREIASRDQLKPFGESRTTEVCWRFANNDARLVPSRVSKPNMKIAVCFDFYSNGVGRFTRLRRSGAAIKFEANYRPAARNFTIFFGNSASASQASTV